MKIALLGYGKEGQAAEKYFKNKYNATFDTFENLAPTEFANLDYSPYDLVLRSPSIPPFSQDPKFTSITRYFFDHCPCNIIGVTATKGKGTTCSFVKSLLDAGGYDAYLVGNIGNPAIEILDQLTPNSVVVYEMSSFQLWDLEKSPHVAVIGHLEPDHLNVHHSFEDYLGAKSHICAYQTNDDYLIYYSKNPDSARLAERSPAHKIPYPFDVPNEILDFITLPGAHNRENAIAAIAAVASFKNLSPNEYLNSYADEIKSGLANFHGLPHRLEFIREINNIRYYDDNFSTNPASTRVAINAFPNDNVIAIIGGRDKTNYADLPEIYEIISSPNVKKVILMGESGHEIAKKYSNENFILADSLESAVQSANQAATNYDSSVVLMSPSAASFDMFKNVYDRGEQYQKIVNKL